jgi:hypothetical protein
MTPTCGSTTAIHSDRTHPVDRNREVTQTHGTQPVSGTGLLLSYLVSTDPQPLRIGTATTPATGTINVYVSEGTKTAYCNETP